MLEAEKLEEEITAKRKALENLKQKSSATTTSHVAAFLSNGTKPTSAKKRKAVESSNNDSG